MQVPAGPQTWHSPLGQSLHVSVPPHPSEMVPHRSAQVPGVQQPSMPAQTWPGSQVLSQEPQFSGSSRFVQVSPQQIWPDSQHCPEQQTTSPQHSPLQQAPAGQHTGPQQD